MPREMNSLGDLQIGQERENGLSKISSFLGRLLRPSHCWKVCCFCNATNAETGSHFLRLAAMHPPSKSFAEQIQKLCLLGK